MPIPISNSVTPLPNAPAVRHSRLWIRAGLVLLAIPVMVWFLRFSILRTVAALWIVDDPVRPVDAVVVLGGGAEYRSFAAADMYKSGTAPRILVANVHFRPTEEMGVRPPETELVVRVLTKRGVPAGNIIRFGRAVTSTHDEALALREWVLSNRVTRVAIPTDPFHTRRVHWFFRKTLRGTGVEVLTPAVSVPGYSASNWWASEEGLIAFQNEVIKTLYYWVKY